MARLPRAAQKLEPWGFEELKRMDGKRWLSPHYETAKRKAASLNAAAPLPFPDRYVSPYADMFSD